MKGFVLQFLLSVFLTWQTFSAPISNDAKLNNRPIIAVLTQHHRQLMPNQSYLAASYVKYLEASGARVVPVPHYLSESQVAEIFKYVNAVFFPGGGIKWFTSAFYKHAKQMWDLAIEANDKGDYFPVWGTCLGFEALQVIRMGKHILSRRVSSDKALALDFLDGANNSRLLRHAPKDLFAAFGTENVTWNHHNWGVTRETYKQYPKLNKFFRILSVNLDEQGKEFISTIEAYKYPIYGVQWHPEKNNFEYTTIYNELPHSANAVRTSQYMANFLVNEARKNFHTFPSKEMENKHLIYNYAPIYSAHIYPNDTMSHFEQIYVF